MTFQPELLDQLLQSYEKPEDLLGEGGILKQLTKALVERCLEAEMKTHLEAQEAHPPTSKPANRRNGHSQKTIKGEVGEAQIAVPRDREGEFEPVIVKKHQTRFDGFDDKISCCKFSIDIYDVAWVGNQVCCHRPLSSKIFRIAKALLPLGRQLVPFSFWRCPITWSTPFSTRPLPILSRSKIL
jgi:putative transposase